MPYIEVVCKENSNNNIDLLNNQVSLKRTLLSDRESDLTSDQCLGY